MILWVKSIKRQVFKLSWTLSYISFNSYFNCISISAFAWLVCVPAGIMSSAVGIKICEIIAGSKK